MLQDFCPLEIKITQCPGGLRLKLLYYVTFLVSFKSQVKCSCVFSIFTQQYNFL